MRWGRANKRGGEGASAVAVRTCSPDEDGPTASSIDDAADRGGSGGREAPDVDLAGDGSGDEAGAVFAEVGDGGGDFVAEGVEVGGLMVEKSGDGALFEQGRRWSVLRQIRLAIEILNAGILFYRSKIHTN